MRKSDVIGSKQIRSEIPKAMLVRKARTITPELSAFYNKRLLRQYNLGLISNLLINKFRAKLKSRRTQKLTKKRGE